MRDEVVIAYASLEAFVKGYKELPLDVPCKFDYEPFEIQEEKTYPLVGIRKVSDIATKRLDKHSEYIQTTNNGKVYSWYEIGVFSLSCTVALFMDFEELNPVPYLRSWYSDIKRRAIKEVRIPTVHDEIPNERLKITINGNPFEQHGDRLYSLKFTVDIEGKMLDCEEARPQQLNNGIKVSV